MDILHAASFRHFFTELGTLEVQNSRALEVFYITGVLPDKNVQVNCIHCQSPMGVRALKGHGCVDWRWRCRGRVPHWMSATSKTFLDYAKLDPTRILCIVLSFVHGFTMSQAMQVSGTSEETCVMWYRLCRRVAHCIAWHDYPGVGGSHDVVEIGETHLFKSNSNKGRRASGQAISIFGGVSRTTKKMFVVQIDDKGGGTFEDAMIDWIHPESTIASDTCEEFTNAGTIFPRHFTVDRTVAFIDPPRNQQPFWLPEGTLNLACLDLKQKRPWRQGQVPFRTHTNNIDRTWRSLRESMKGSHRVQWVDSYLGESMYRRNILADVEQHQRLERFLKDVARVHPGPFKVPMDEDIIACLCHECNS